MSWPTPDQLPLQIAPPIIEKEAPQLREHIHEVYPVAMDSLDDYDPVWQKCLDLKLAVASHTSARGTIGGRRRSPFRNEIAFGLFRLN